MTVSGYQLMGRNQKGQPTQPMVCDHLDSEHLVQSNNTCTCIDVISTCTWTWTSKYL